MAVHMTVIFNSGVGDIDLHIRRRFQVWLSAAGGRERLLVSSSESGLVVLSERLCLLWLVFGVKDHLFLQGLPSLKLHALDLLLELLHVVLREAAYHDPFEHKQKLNSYGLVLQILKIVHIK